ncbi:hypothetical protein ACNSOL_12455 (plasmid) [Aliarcobacter lanthieri]|uniref:hypothetical protein n=1 Tax=Aliarcobacter lanthieri TaxID=1355374 RepID=UPI003AACE676
MKNKIEKLGLNLDKEIEILNIKSESYEFSSHKYSNGCYENNLLSFEMKFKGVDFFINFFRGANYREEETEVSFITKEYPDISFQGFFTQEDDERELVADGSYELEEELLKIMGSVHNQIDFYDCVLKFADSMQDIKNLKRDLFSLASGKLYTVSVVAFNNLEEYHSFLEKEEAEELFVKLCEKWYREDGLENYKEYLESNDFIVDLTSYEQYHGSEFYHDSCDNAKVSLDIM